MIFNIVKITTNILIFNTNKNRYNFAGKYTAGNCVAEYVLDSTNQFIACASTANPGCNACTYASSTTTCTGCCNYI